MKEHERETREMTTETAKQWEGDNLQNRKHQTTTPRADRFGGTEIVERESTSENKEEDG